MNGRQSTTAKVTALEWYATKSHSSAQRFDVLSFVGRTVLQLDADAAVPVDVSCDCRGVFGHVMPQLAVYAYF